MSAPLRISARAVTLGRLLHAAGGSATVAELRESSGTGQTTAAAALKELVATGLVERLGGAKGTPRLTAAGQVYFAGVDPVSAGAVVDAAAGVWPYTHAAFLRLYLAAVVARHHLGPYGPHLGFVIVGEPRTGKSALFAQACHLLGLDPDTHTRELALMKPGGIAGRRSGGAAVSFEAAEYLDDPVILFDEFDKAPAALREHAQTVLLQGKYRTIVEGQQVTVRCAPMLAGNVPADTGDRFAHVHRAYRTRRSVLLDAGAVRGHLSDLGARLDAYHTSCTPGALALERLVPPATSLPSARPLWEQLRGFLAAGHDDEFPDERALGLLALGYAALRGVQPGDQAGLDLAAIYVVIDWHTCASTVPGLTDPGAGSPQLNLAEAHRAYYSGRSDFVSLEAAIAAQHAGAEARAAHARAAARARVRVDDAVVRGRGELAEQLRQARAALEARKVPEPHKAQAAGLRDVLGKLRTHVQLISKQDALEQARERAGEHMVEAHQLAQRITAERAEQQRARNDAIRAERQDRAAAAGAAKEQAAMQRRYVREMRQRTRAELTNVRTVLRELEKLHRRTKTPTGSNPLAELRRLNLVHYEPLTTPAAEPPRRGLARLFGSPPPPPGQWVAASMAFPGGPGYCYALAQWGEHTRAVIAAALAEGYAREDDLCARLGVAPRARRLELGAPAPRQIGPVRPR